VPLLPLEALAGAPEPEVALALVDGTAPAAGAGGVEATVVTVALVLLKDDLCRQGQILPLRFLPALACHPSLVTEQIGDCP